MKFRSSVAPPTSKNGTTLIFSKYYRNTFFNQAMPLIKYTTMTLNIKNINILFVYEVDVHNKYCDHSLFSFRTLF